MFTVRSSDHVNAGTRPGYSASLQYPEVASQVTPKGQSLSPRRDFAEPCNTDFLIQFIAAEGTTKPTLAFVGWWRLAEALGQNIPSGQVFDVPPNFRKVEYSNSQYKITLQHNRSRMHKARKGPVPFVANISIGSVVDGNANVVNAFLSGTSRQ